MKLKYQILYLIFSEKKNNEKIARLLFAAVMIGTLRVKERICFWREKVPCLKRSCPYKINV